MLRVLPTDISLPGTLRTYARLKSAYLDETEVGLDLRGGCELGFTWQPGIEVVIWVATRGVAAATPRSTMPGNNTAM